MTVSKNCWIKIWQVEENRWNQLYEFLYNQPCFNNVTTVLNSSLSCLRSYLSVFTEEKIIILFKLSNMETFPNETDKVTSIECILRRGYKYRINCCQFSQNEKYLAVALSNGDIKVSLSNVYFFFFY